MAAPAELDADATARLELGAFEAATNVVRHTRPPYDDAHLTYHIELRPAAVSHQSPPFGTGKPTVRPGIAGVHQAHPVTELHHAITYQLSSPSMSSGGRLMWSEAVEAWKFANVGLAEARSDGGYCREAALSGVQFRVPNSIPARLETLATIPMQPTGAIKKHEVGVERDLGDILQIGLVVDFRPIFVCPRIRVAVLKYDGGALA
jgi:hypothetical protein